LGFSIGTEGTGFERIGVVVSKKPFGHHQGKEQRRKVNPQYGTKNKNLNRVRQKNFSIDKRVGGGAKVKGRCMLTPTKPRSYYCGCRFIGGGLRLGTLGKLVEKKGGGRWGGGKGIVMKSSVRCVENASLQPGKKRTSV